MGVVLAWLVLPRIQSRWGWQYCFYMPAALGAIWVVVWVAVAPRHRRDALNAASSEVNESSKLLEDDQREAGTSTEATVSQKTTGQWLWVFLTSSAMWGVYTASFASAIVFYTLLSYLPQYMKQRYDLDLANAAEVSVVPYVVRALILVTAGPLADRLISREFRLSWVRKGMTWAALSVPAISLLVLAVSDQGETVAVALLVIGVGASGMINVGSMFGPIDMSVSL